MNVEAERIQLSERMFPRLVCQSGSFNRWTASRPILSIQLNCVRFKLQDSSSDSQSNLDQRKEERELPAADQALLGQLSLNNTRRCCQARPVLQTGGLRCCPVAAIWELKHCIDIYRYIRYSQGPNIFTLFRLT